MTRIYEMDPAHPRIAELGPDWIRVGDITADGTAHEIDADPGTVIIAEGVSHVISNGKPLELHRWWTLRVTGSKHDGVTLSVTSPLGNPFWSGRVDIDGVVLESASDKRPGGAS